MSRYFKIEDICKVRGGKRIPQGETLQEEKNTHPYIRILDMYQGRILNLNEHMLYAREKYWDKIKSYIVDEGDVILAIVGNTLGMVSIIGKTLEKANLTENCCRFSDVDTEKVLPLFLYYSLKAPLNQKQIEVFRVGSSQPKLPIYNVNQLLIPQYSLTVQRKIIDTLSAIDSKIENNNAINVELESMAKTIYDYWFLQFDFPDENGKPYKSSGGKMVWNKELKRELPEGWRVADLKEIASITMGTSPKGDSINTDGKGIVFYQGKADFGNRFPITRTYTNAPIRYADVNDILLSVRAPVGTLNIANKKCCIGRGLAAIHSKYSSFMYYIMSANQYKFDIYNNGGTTFGAITKDDLFGIRVVFPKEVVIDKFEKRINCIDQEIFRNNQENQELVSLRDFLLPLLMNGQVGFKR